MRDGEPQMYTALVTLRNGYVQSQWSRVQMFLAFNPLAFPFIVNAGQTERFKLLVSLAGVLVHLILLQGTLRADKWVQQIDMRLKLIEELRSDHDSGPRVKFFADNEFAQMRGSRVASRRIFWAIGTVVLAIWIVLTIIHIYGIIR